MHALQRRFYNFSKLINLLRDLISGLHPPPLLPRLLEIAPRRVSTSKDRLPPKQGPGEVTRQPGEGTAEDNGDRFGRAEETRSLVQRRE